MAAATRKPFDDRRDTYPTRTSRTDLLPKLGRAAACVIALAALAGGASALDDLSPGRIAASEGGSCPVLTQIKYPFITCAANEYGGVTLGIPDQPAPLACELRLADGSCAASPEEWQLDTPHYGPAE